jgi:hypothetical protein
MQIAMWKRQIKSSIINDRAAYFPQITQINADEKIRVFHLRNLREPLGLNKKPCRKSGRVYYN